MSCKAIGWVAWLDGGAHPNSVMKDHMSEWNDISTTTLYGREWNGAPVVVTTDGYSFWTDLDFMTYIDKIVIQILISQKSDSNRWRFSNITVRLLLIARTLLKKSRTYRPNISNYPKIGCVSGNLKFVKHQV